MNVYLTFFGAALLLALTPGPGILFVLAQTVKGGKSSGLSASLGTGIGGMFHVLMGAFGISALIYASAQMFEVIKMLGALFLFWLGFKALKEKTEISAESIDAIRLEGHSFRQGILTEALNPKTALFFLAFIPQFLNLSKSTAFQFIILGTCSVLLNTLVDLLVVFSSGYLVEKLRVSKVATRSFRYISATTYFGLGLLAIKAKGQAG